MTTTTNPMPPVPAVAAARAYRPSLPPYPVDLRLDGNEGTPPDALLAALEAPAAVEAAHRYPSARALEARLARRLGVAAERVLVTCGADDALDRIARTFLAPEREVVLPVPTFVMIPRYVALTGAAVRAVAWPGGPYPTDAVLARVGEATALVAMVSPNNPTGAVATADDLDRVADGARRAWVLLDHAYVEYADEDLTAQALALPNALVVRTLSKAWGLAGLRVGYVAGPAEAIDALRRVGNPYAVSGPSLAIAERCLGAGEARARAGVERVRAERAELAALLAGLGARIEPSSANFVLVRLADALRVRDELARRGIAVRGFPDEEGLEDALRITCPGDGADLARLSAALQEVLDR